MVRPNVLQDHLSWYTPQRVLCLDEQNLLVVPGLKDIWQFLTRARPFSALAPVWWNFLPSDIHALQDLVQFFMAYKTEMLWQAYG